MKHNPSSMKITLTLTLAFLSLHLFAQNITQWADAQKPVLYEKVYLHIDREFYSPGDTIWFKSYLVSGLDNKLEPGYKNIYAQLVSPTGEVISNRLLMSIFGEANGDFALTDSLPDGQYTVRAYTKYLENFGEESYFHKRVWIAKSKSLFESKLPGPDKTQTTNSNLPNPAGTQPIDVMFFPEGGNLVLNAANHVAFKAIDSSGKGIEVSGKVVDGNGGVAATFQTSFLGMGKFIFMPTEGKTYFAEIDSFPNFKYRFDKILENGVALNFQDKGNEVMTSLSRNIKSTGQQTFYLAATHKGVVLFHQGFEMNDFNYAVKLGKNLFPLGISKLRLLDSNLNIVAERLVFIDDYYGNSVDIKLGKEEFTTREKVGMGIEPLLAPGDSVASTLSVAVVNGDYFNSVGNNQTIESYLLVDSELKGVIESPALYFFDGDSISSAEKLDLLMMVQGWRSYYWDDIAQQAPKDLKGWDDTGLSYSGYVKRLFRNQPVVGGQVVFGPYSHFLFEKTKTDSLGRFRFERLFLKDSANITINAKNQRGGKNVWITLDPVLKYTTSIDTTPINKTVGWIGIPQKYSRKIKYQLMADKEFNPGIGSILLEGVEVFGKGKDEIRYDLTRPFILFDKSWKITKDDYQYEDVYGFIARKVGSLFLGQMNKWGLPKIVYIIDGDMREAASSYYEDRQSYIESIPIQNIYRIDLLKTGYFDIPEFYYIYQKYNRAAFRPATWGRIDKQVNGFQKPNEFYSPKYSLENIKNPIPDYRPTLFWSPQVTVKDGKAEVEFFTCDNLGDYLVFVEGISQNGKICFGVKQFRVTDFNSAIKK